MLHFIQKPAIANQTTGFYMKCKTGLKWANENTLLKNSNQSKKISSSGFF